MAVDYATLKKGGFMRQKQKNHFSLRLRVVGGNLTAKQLAKIAEVAEQFGDGHVHLTSRQSVEIPFVKLDQIEEVKAALAEGDVEPGVCYYHAGDTSLFKDMKLIREMYKPDIMAVGISGIEKKYPCEMNPREAAFATQWIGPNVVIPTHYEPGSEALGEYLEFVKTTSPKAVVQTVVDKTWTYTPFSVE